MSEMLTGLTLEEADEQLCRLYEARKSQAVIAEALGMTKFNVEMRLKYYRDRDEGALKRQGPLGFFNEDTKTFNWDMWPTLPKKSWTNPPGCVSGQAPPVARAVHQTAATQLAAPPSPALAPAPASADINKRLEMLEGALKGFEVLQNELAELKAYQRAQGRYSPVFDPPYFTGEKQAFTARIDSGLLAKVAELAKARHQSLTRLYTEALVEFVEAQGRR